LQISWNLLLRELLKVLTLTEVKSKVYEMGDIIGMRNRLIHGYDVVDDEVVWRTAEENIPPLMSKLAAWLEANP